MLIGEYKHNLDPKKRLSIPSKFRKELGEGAVLTRGLDNCLFVFPSQSWKPFAEMLAGLSMAKKDTRSFSRLFLSGAIEVEFDSLGRPYLNTTCNTATSCNSSAGATVTVQSGAQTANITVQIQTGMISY